MACHLGVQQDDARSYTTRISLDYLLTVNTLPWPARSPELTPIEHVLDMASGKWHVNYGVPVPDGTYLLIRILELRAELMGLHKLNLKDLKKWAETILLERQQTKSVGRWDSRSTFLRSDWPRPFARREVGVQGVGDLFTATSYVKSKSVLLSTAICFIRFLWENAGSQSAVGRWFNKQFYFATVYE
ncbi:hypothetical protein TNCV_1607011 [Trichonephila clavipes]|nr:hypothetical protein TNCV_1607011 [Trichonephila clavipes]